MTRKHVLSANTQFTCAQFFPTAVQVLATGTDRKISYWESFDGSLVRYVEGSSKGCINWLSINSSGEMFISGGDDQIIKVHDQRILECDLTILVFIPLFMLVMGLSNSDTSRRRRSTCG